MLSSGLSDNWSMHSKMQTIISSWFFSIDNADLFWSWWCIVTASHSNKSLVNSLLSFLQSIATEVSLSPNVSSCFYPVAIFSVNIVSLCGYNLCSSESLWLFILEMMISCAHQVASKIHSLLILREWFFLQPFISLDEHQLPCVSHFHFAYHRSHSIKWHLVIVHHPTLWVIISFYHLSWDYVFFNVVATLWEFHSIPRAA